MGAWRGTYATESRQQTEHFSSDLAGCVGHARAGGVACADSVDGRGALAGGRDNTRERLSLCLFLGSTVFGCRSVVVYRR